MVAKYLTEVKNDMVSWPFLTHVINKQCILVFNSEKVNINRVKNKIGVKNVIFRSGDVDMAYQSQLGTKETN